MGSGGGLIALDVGPLASATPDASPVGACTRKGFWQRGQAIRRPMSTGSLIDTRFWHSGQRTEKRTKSPADPGVASDIWSPQQIRAQHARRVCFHLRRPAPGARRWSLIPAPSTGKQDCRGTLRHSSSVVQRKIRSSRSHGGRGALSLTYPASSSRAALRSVSPCSPIS